MKMTKKKFKENASLKQNDRPKWIIPLEERGNEGAIKKWSAEPTHWYSTFNARFYGKSLIFQHFRRIFTFRRTHFSERRQKVFFFV